MSSDTITVSPSTTSGKEVLESLHLGCIDAADRNDSPKAVRKTLCSMCTYASTHRRRHPDWTLLEVVFAAIESVQRTNLRNIPLARDMLLDVVRDLYPEECIDQIAGTSVIFEVTPKPVGVLKCTQLSLVSLSDCRSYALKHYANAWGAATGRDACDDIETRTKRAIKRGQGTMRSDEKRHVLLRETQEDVAAAFERHVKSGRSPYIFLL